MNYITIRSAWISCTKKGKNKKGQEFQRQRISKILSEDLLVKNTESCEDSYDAEEEEYIEAPAS